FMSLIDDQRRARLLEGGDDPRRIAGILFALRREARPFLRLLGRGQGAPHLPSVLRARVYDEPCFRLVVAETGIRRRGALETAERLLDLQPPLRPRLLIAAGFAGALAADLRVGDVVVATEVADTNRHCWPTQWPLEIAEPARSGVRLGRLLTSSRI